MVDLMWTPNNLAQHKREPRKNLEMRQKSIGAPKRRRLSPPENETAAVTKKFYQNASNWDLEANYAERSRKKKGKDKKNDKLPIKTSEGIVEHAEEADGPSEDEVEDEQGEAGADAAAEQEKDPEEEEEPEDVRPLKVQVLEAKEDLARMAGSISEDPEENIGQLKGLAKIASSRVPTIKKLAMATQLAVFKDIIPGYRIRALSDEDMKAKLSKDVKRLRIFEQTLVSCYREYVRGLARAIKSASNNRTEEKASIASTAMICLCTLLEAVPHFNFRNDLLNTLVLKLSSRSVDKDFHRARTAMETLFTNDEDGNASLEAVSLLTKMFKSKDYNIHSSVLNTFLSLRLLSEYSYRASMNRIDKEDPDAPPPPKVKKSKREFRTKRERKRLRETKVIEKEMVEADAAVSHEEREKNQSEMLKLVFVAYFRILKKRTPHLMGAVLEGLARYAHLINQDFFGDILESLRDLISWEVDEDEETEEVGNRRDKSRETLLCTVTAFALLQGQDTFKAANGLHLDLSFFTQRLYNEVLPLSLDGSIEVAAKITTAEEYGTVKQQDADPKKKEKINVQTPSLLMLRALQALLLPPQNARSVPPTLLAAFTKRLMTSALHLPEKSTLAVLALVKQVLKVQGGKISGLWYSEERKGDGVFDMEREEPTSSNPFAGNVWEGELLKLHWSEKVKEAAKDIEREVVSRRK
ncbi:nucleolar complex-associated protein-domain-containing protein [Elsinoe ampelina]|uniref:Nucleolar complex-associated protein 3 n=1 Tax=Elsinoe ampelina TaxID=302913 RepID=A0A6A6G349_9PEZI|nr:nucleolar complex-associated protein-domain-containing protein [Elsinoe ampelina]